MHSRAPQISHFCWWLVIKTHVRSTCTGATAFMFVHILIFVVVFMCLFRCQALLRCAGGSCRVRCLMCLYYYLEFEGLGWTG